MQRRALTDATLRQTLQLLERLAQTSVALGWTEQAEHLRQRIESLERRLQAPAEPSVPASEASDIQPPQETPGPAPTVDRADLLPAVLLTPAMATLTPRQRDVALLIAQGASNAEIAQRLVLSQGSVANYVAAILDRLGFSNRSQVAAWVTEQRGPGDLMPIIGLLEALQSVAPGGLKAVLSAAAQLIARAFEADKVDAFVLDEEREQLVALGVSDTPMGRRERQLHLDVLPLRHGGRMAQVFKSRQPFLHGHADQDPEELLAITRDLGVRSTLAVPLDIPSDGQGVLAVTSARPEAFSANQLRLLAFVARWLELICALAIEENK